MTNDVIQQQMAYYRARAGEYDEWFYRVGRYDRGAAMNLIWFDEGRLLAPLCAMTADENRKFLITI